MTALWLAVPVAAVGWWLTALWRERRAQPDAYCPDNRPRYAYTTPMTYDEARAITAAREARRRTAAGRLYRPEDLP